MKSYKKQEKELKKLEENAEKPFILFSFDGAVMDTEPAIIATYHQIFDMYGKEDFITADNEQEIIRAGEEDVFKKYLPTQDTRKCVEAYNSYQRNHLIDLIQPMKGAPAFLEWLKANGYKVGIVSARERSIVVELLRHTSLDVFIDIIIGSAGHLDERADAILTACRLANAKTCVFITDSSGNIRSGTEVGCFTIGIVSHPARTKALSEAGAGFLTKDYKEIKKLLKGEPMWLAYELMYPEDVEKAMKKAAKKAKKAEEKAKEKEKKKAEKPAEEKKEAVKKPAARKTAAKKTTAEKKPAAKKTTARKTTAAKKEVK